VLCAGCESSLAGPDLPFYETGYWVTFAIESSGFAAPPEILRARWDGLEEEFLAFGSGPTWSPVGSELLYINAGIHALSLLDGSDALLRSGTAEHPPVRVFYSPGGESYAYLEFGWSGCSAIYASRRFGLTDIDLGDHCSADPQLEWRLQWSPDASELLFHSQDFGGSTYDIFATDVEGAYTWNLTDSPWDDHSPCYSPDGATIAYISNRRTGSGAEGELHLMAWDGTAVRRLTDGPARLPAFSPDGQRVAFLRPGDGLYTIRPDGSEEYFVTTNATGLASFPVAPRWSPDGEWIAYVADNGHLYTVRPDGGDNGPVSRAPLADGAFDWSPTPLTSAFK
jgi:Tol biopolymer transport system component